MLYVLHITTIQNPKHVLFVLYLYDIYIIYKAFDRIYITPKLPVFLTTRLPEVGVGGRGSAEGINKIRKEKGLRN
jgi:hypothetical protein